MPVLVMMQSSSLCLWCFYIWSYGRQCPDDYFGHEVWKLRMTRQFLTRDLLLLTHWQETASEQLTPCIGIHVTCYLLQLASKCFCWIVSCVTEALRWKDILSWSSRQITQAGALFHVMHDSFQRNNWLSSTATIQSTCRAWGKCSVDPAATKRLWVSIISAKKNLKEYSPTRYSITSANLQSVWFGNYPPN